MGLLEKVCRRYKLAVLSNYPCGKTVRESLERTGIVAMLNCVVVFCDVFFVKPHPRLFMVVLNKLQVAAAHIEQWPPPEHFEPQPEDMEPDFKLDHLTGLIGFL